MTLLGRRALRYLLLHLRVRWHGLATSPAMCIFPITIVSGAASCVTGFVVILTKGNLNPNDTCTRMGQWYVVLIWDSPSLSLTYSEQCLHIPVPSSSITIVLPCILPITPLLNLAVGVIIASKSSTTVSFLFPAMFCNLAPGRVNGPTRPLIHRKDPEIHITP